MAFPVGLVYLIRRALLLFTTHIGMEALYKSVRCKKFHGGRRGHATLCNGGRGCCDQLLLAEKVLTKSACSAQYCELGFCRGDRSS